MDELLNYEPSQKMLDAMEANFSDASLTAVDATFGLYLQSRQVDFDNICTVLRILVSIEDISSIKPYTQLIQYKAQVHQCCHNPIMYKCLLNPFKKENLIKSILTPKIDQIMLYDSLPKFKLREAILTLTAKKEKHSDGLLHIAQIHCVTRSQVTFAFEEDKDGVIDCIPPNKHIFDVIFYPLRYPCRLIYNALEIIEKNADIRRYLFPIFKKEQTPATNTLDTLTLNNTSIATNAEQLQAVQQIVAGPNPQAPYIVFGPPGTGKTTTIVESILQLYLQGNNRILVTAGSNSACDTIAIKLFEGIKHKFPGASKYPMRRFHSASRIMPAALIEVSIILTNKELAEGKLLSYKIIVATLCSVGRMFKNCKDVRFSHVFIDEAAASTEAETLMAITYRVRGPCHIILSGDHKQLGPVIMSDRAASLGLGQSLMDRLLLNTMYEVDASGNYDKTLQTRLRRNYRSHPEIVGIYNKLYYNGELIPLAPLEQVSQAANWSVLPNGQFPIIFQAAQGATEREAHSTSSFNKKEVDILCWYVLKLLCDGLGDGIKVKQDEIGVVTPYLGQCRMIKQILKDRKQHNVEVGSVESYQGREKTIIIASMVSSFRSAQFLSNPRRVNVLLSRAKSLMILIGNPITLNGNNDFQFIIDQCKKNNNFLSEELVEADIKKNSSIKLKLYKEMWEAEEKLRKEKEKRKNEEVLHDMHNLCI